MNTNIELEELQRFIATEKRLSAASANRENQLNEKSSSAKARLLSPQDTPMSNADLEARIEQANLRRELHLTQKIEKAKKYRNSPVNKELFATVSPKQESDNGSVGTPIIEVRSYRDSVHISAAIVKGETSHSFKLAYHRDKCRDRKHAPRAEHVSGCHQWSCCRPRCGRFLLED